MVYIRTIRISYSIQCFNTLGFEKEPSLASIASRLPHFQYLYGSIKSLVEKGADIHALEFQYLYGSIKRQLPCKHFQERLWVSIPLWFD